MTIANVTHFYLGQDPTDASLVPIYYCNLVYWWKARWHMAIVFEQADVKDAVRVIAWTYLFCSGGLVMVEERKVRRGRKAVGGGS